MNTARYDSEGFLRELDEWDHGVAEDIAALEGIALTEAHWEVIELLREYYRRFESSPDNCL